MSFIKELTLSTKAFFLGIYYGFTDLLPFINNERAEPNDDDQTISKYFIKSKWRNYAITESVSQIIVVLILLISIRVTIGEFRFIPSESMYPTMQIGDKLFVEKITRLTQKKYKHGDILIFFPPATANDDNKDHVKQDPLSLLIRLTGLPFLPQPEAYIKRLIGLPGDIIEVKANDGLYINNHKIDEPYHLNSSQYMASYNYGPVKVPDKHYFVLGDNRNYSFDSHYWGFLPQNRVIGKAAFLIFRDLGTPTQNTISFE